MHHRKSMNVIPLGILEAPRGLERCGLPRTELDAATERELNSLAKGRRVEARLQQRARVILLAAQGWQNKEIAIEVDLDRRQVALWRSRLVRGGVRRRSSRI